MRDSAELAPCLENQVEEKASAAEVVEEDLQESDMRVEARVRDKVDEETSNDSRRGSRESQKSPSEAQISFGVGDKDSNRSDHAKEGDGHCNDHEGEKCEHDFENHSREESSHESIHDSKKESNDGVRLNSKEVSEHEFERRDSESKQDPKQSSRRSGDDHVARSNESSHTDSLRGSVKLKGNQPPEEMAAQDVAESLGASEPEIHDSHNAQAEHNASTGESKMSSEQESCAQRNVLTATEGKKKGKKPKKKNNKLKKNKPRTVSAYSVPNLKAKPKRKRVDQGFGLYGNAALIRPVRESLNAAGQFGCDRPVLSPRLLHSDALASTSGNNKAKSRAKELRKELAEAQIKSRTNQEDQMDSAYAWENDVTNDLVTSEEGSRKMVIPDEISETAEETSETTQSANNNDVSEAAMMTMAEKQELEILSAKVETFTKHLARIRELSAILRRKPVAGNKSPKVKKKYKAELATARAAVEDAVSDADQDADTVANVPSGGTSKQKDLVAMYGQLNSLVAQLNSAKAQLCKLRAKSAQRKRQLCSPGSEAKNSPDTRPGTCPGLSSPGGFGKIGGFGTLDGPEPSWTEVQEMIESRALMFEQQLQKRFSIEQERAQSKESSARNKIEKLGGIIQYINSEMGLESPPDLREETLNTAKSPKTKSPTPVKVRQVEVLSHRRRASKELAEAKKLAGMSPLSRLANPTASFAANLPSSIRDPTKISTAQSLLLQPVRTTRRCKK